MIAGAEQPHLQNLNPPQLAGVTHFEGPILILAGAGSGKTRVLTRRVAHLVLEKGIRPHHILAITFTNKATKEMQDRLHALLGKQADYLWIATFHSTALKILRRHATLLGYKDEFTVYDDQDTKSLLKEIIKSMKLDEKKYPPQYFSRIIDSAKNAGVSPEEYAKAGAGYEHMLNAEVYDKYQRALLKSNAMDFGDLLVNVVKLLEGFPDVLKLYQNTLRFVLVDEFQDTNAIQYRFVTLLTEIHKNLFVVGDDDQSIYAFRGATVRNILEFENDYPGAKVVKLEQNYRSTSNILDLAHAVIEKIPERRRKKLWTESEKGLQVKTFVGFDESDESQYIVNEISKLQAADIPLNEISIFYRTNAQSRAIEDELVRSKIPYKIFGGLKFYERKEIKDIVAYLRIIFSESDNQAFGRIVNTPPRGIGAQALKRVTDESDVSSKSWYQSARDLSSAHKGLAQFVALIEQLKKESEQLTLSQLIVEIIKRSGYGAMLEVSKDVTSQSRLENLSELVAISIPMESSGETRKDVMKSFLDRISLSTSSDPTPEDPSVEADEKHPQFVSLMTLHIAKGLEFDTVFLTGLEEGLIPHYRSMENKTELNEERRLLYVGITRAKRELYLLRAKTRSMFSGAGGFGQSGYFREVSRFAKDFPEDLLNHDGEHFFAGGGYGDTVEVSDDAEDFSFMDEYKPTAATPAVKKGKKPLFLLADELLASNRNKK